MWIYGFRLLSPWLVSAILGASEGGRGVLFSTFDVEGLSHKVSETRVSTQRISIISVQVFQFGVRQVLRLSKILWVLVVITFRSEVTKR